MDTMKSKVIRPACMEARVDVQSLIAGTDDPPGDIDMESIPASTNVTILTDDVTVLSPYTPANMEKACEVGGGAAAYSPRRRAGIQAVLRTMQSTRGHD